MENVYLIKNHLLCNLSKLLSSELGKMDLKGKKVAVKAHMGEYGNLNYVRPPIVGAVVEEIKKAGGKPFLFDTPVAYHGSRDTVEKYQDTARRNGFTEETIGCPVLISDTGVKVKSKFLSKLEIVKELTEADAFVVVSHFKGHSLANYGASIKNLGMGCVTKESKGIMHSATHVKYDSSKCIGCGTCAEVCPEGAFEIKNKKAVFNERNCHGCGGCVRKCPSKALTYRTVPLGKALAEAAALILNYFKKDKVIFINLVLDIARNCDCLPIGDSEAGPKVAPDIGIVVSHNIVAADKASLDLVNKATDGKFSEIFPADINLQTDSATEFGLGDGKYKIVDV
jgi:hypothetical protein